jgi:hypothetical protein
MVFHVLEFENTSLDENLSNFLETANIQTHYSHHPQHQISDCISVFIPIKDPKILKQNNFIIPILTFRENYNHPMICVISKNDAEILTHLKENLKIYPFTTYDLTNEETREIFKNIDIFSVDISNNIECGNYYRAIISEILFYNEREKNIILYELKYFYLEKEFIKFCHGLEIVSKEVLNDIKEERKGKERSSKLYTKLAKKSYKRSFFLIDKYLGLSVKIERSLYLNTFKLILEDNIKEIISEIMNEIAIEYSRIDENEVLIKIKNDTEEIIKIDAKLFERVLGEFFEEFGHFPKIIEKNILEGMEK